MWQLAMVEPHCGVMLVRRNTYTTLNALAGHFNSFGNAQPLPKKRFERAVKVWLHSCP